MTPSLENNNQMHILHLCFNIQLKGTTAWEIIAALEPVKFQAQTTQKKQQEQSEQICNKFERWK